MGNDVLPREVAELLPYLTETERQELDSLLRDLPLWLPLPGPQLAAYTTQADIIGFGGAAGGGKTDLACGKALSAIAATSVSMRFTTAPARSRCVSWRRG